MAIRPAKCYRKMERAYTRKSKRKPRKSYVKGVPDPKIQKFVGGDLKRDFQVKLVLVAEREAQVRHNALHAIRITLNKMLTDNMGKDAFFMKILIYPHHIMRENPIATGAGADRYQTGMKKAFGRPIGFAARVKAGQKLVELRFDKGKEPIAKKAMKIAASKMPTPCRIVSG